MQLSNTQQELLERYAQMLLSWNAIHSLSGAKDYNSIYKNIQDALYPLDSIHLWHKTLLLDIGSGNGFPALPLHIALKIPTILCEPNVKKASFLHNLKAELRLEHLYIQRKNIESLKLDSPPDCITSRATFSLTKLLEKCKHCIGGNTTFLLYKGSNVDNEIPQWLKHTQIKHNQIRYLIIEGKDLP